MTRPLIIGIHGLDNKPEKSELTDWWYTSIIEGLRKNEGNETPEFDFEMVYWADVNHRNHYHNDINRPELFNTEPYIEAEEGALVSERDWFFASAAANAFELGAEVLDELKERLGGTVLLDRLLDRFADDLNTYYTKEEKREAMRARLDPVLKNYEGRKIMVIAHSMGSIIAYDVLTILGNVKPGFNVDHFVTIGSPLGLEHVQGKIVEEFLHRGEARERLRTPTVVKNRWVNHADRKDPVAVDANLSNDYTQNKHNVICEDDRVRNDYKIVKQGMDKASHNHHKSYGYLRTPEMSKLINDFIKI